MGLNVYVRNRADLLFWTIFKNCHHFTHKSVQKCNFGFYSITGNYTNEIRLKVCQKSISEKKNMVANFGFNCKIGKVFFLLGTSEVWNFVGPKMSSFEQIWKLYSKTVIILHTNLFKNAILGSTQLLATTLMKLD